MVQTTLPGGHPIPVDVEGVMKKQFLLDYAAQLRELIVKGADCGDTPLEGMKIIVDAGNGSGGFFAEHVLQPLGADIAGSQFLDPDGGGDVCLPLSPIMLSHPTRDV